MLFTKEELSFISIFAKCADNKQIQNDKFRIKATSETQEVIFSQFSNDIVLIKTLNKKVEDDFEVIFPVNQFLPLVNSIPDGESIDIKSDGITFNGNRYEFESYDLSSVFSNTDSFKNIQKDESSRVTINDFLNTKNSFMGLDGYDCTLLVSSNFISAPNDSAIVCAYRTSNKPDVSFYIPKLAVLIGLENKLNDLDFYYTTIGDQKYTIVSIYDVNIMFLNKEYELPDICQNELKEMYEHPNKIEFNKSALKDSLNRIKIFSSKNIYTRIRCNTTNNQFIIESKEPNSGYAVEKIEASIDNELMNKENIFIISQADLSTSVNALKGDKIIIRAASDAFILKVTDEIENDFFLVRCVPE